MGYHDEKMPVGAVSTDSIAQMLMNTGAMDMVYNRTKKMMWSMVQYKELQMMYSCALKEMQTKFEVLDTEFKLKYNRNPISSISTRLKRSESIMEKLTKNNFPISLDSIEQNIHDVAGIRVICAYIDDIYKIADALLKQDDVTLIDRKDYIKNPKPNGYRSLHIIVSIPVFFEEKKKNMKVEVQIRTIAMDFWASLEHQLKYKKDIDDEQDVIAELKACADVISETDEKMLNLRQRLEEAEDIPTEEDILFDRLRRLDVPIN